MDVLLLPVGLTLLALVLFYVGFWIEKRKGKRAPWKWAAVLPLVVAVVMGTMAVVHYGDAFYRNYVESQGGTRKMMAAHYGALIIPVLGLAAIVLFHYFGDRINLMQEE